MHILQAGVSFSAYLRRVAEKQAEAEGSVVADVEEALRSTLARIDEFGVRGMQAVNEAEVFRPRCHTTIHCPLSCDTLSHGMSVL